MLFIQLLRYLGLHTKNDDYIITDLSLSQPLVYIYVDILHIEGTSCIQPLYLEHLYGLQDPSVS